MRAMSDTNLLARFQAFDSLEAQYGDDGPFPLLFASDLFHRGPLVGRSLTVSLDMFERAIRYSPGGTPAPAYDHMIWGWTRLGERARANAWLAARRSLGSHAPGEPPIPEFLQLGYDLRWVPWRAKLKLWYLNRAGSEDDLTQLGRVLPLQRDASISRRDRTRWAASSRPACSRLTGPVGWRRRGSRISPGAARPRDSR